MPDEQTSTPETTDSETSAETTDAQEQTETTETPAEDEFVDDNAEPDKNAVDSQPEQPKTPAATQEKAEDAQQDAGDDRLEQVTRELNSVKDHIAQQKVETNLKSLLDQNPEYKPYEARI